MPIADIGAASGENKFKKCGKFKTHKIKRKLIVFCICKMKFISVFDVHLME